MFVSAFSRSIDVQKPVSLPPPPSPLDFKNKVIIITCANSSIGAATAMEFAKWGGLLTIVGRKTESMDELAERILDVHDHSPLIIHADMKKTVDLQHIIDKTMATYGHIDVLINNALAIDIGSIETTTIDQYDRIMDINMRAVFQLTSLAVPHLIDAKGCIVNVSSVNGLRAVAGLLVYSISQAALDQFTRCVALELAPKGVRCNSVNPDSFATYILHRTDDKDDDAGNDDHRIIDGASDVNHSDLVNEVAGVIAFLASNMTSCITGANLPIGDGSRT